MGSTVKPRPVSVATEFMEDWEVDDEALETEIEDIEEEGENSPRVSLNSVCLLSLLRRRGISLTLRLVGTTKFYYSFVV
jgi:hypothetical protein